MSSVSSADPAVLSHVVERAAAGDAAAFAQLIAAHHADLRRVAYLICGDRDMAEDAVQQAWVIAWRRLRTVRDASAIRSWLVAVAANEARKLARRQGRRIVMEASVRAVMEPASEADADLLDLGPALARLSLDDRELLAMRYVVGLDSFEIAAIRGGSASGVRARLSRLLARLRKEFDDA